MRSRRTIAAAILVVLSATMTSGARGLATGPAILVVATTADSGAGSLRAAIDLANTNPGPDTIVFNLPTSDPGFNGQWFTIKPLSPLPWLTDGGTAIDGSTQRDTNPAGPEIVLNGEFAGLALASSGNRIDQLVINGSTVESAVDIRGSNNSVTGSYVGLDATGTIAVANRCHGISVLSGTGNVIGGSSPAARNVISGNVCQGISIHSSRNSVRGNFIGTDRTGTQALGNGLAGVFIWPCPYTECAGPAQGNVVGGREPGDRNVISGNHVGVWLEDSGNVVQGNYIGADVSGTQPLGNRHDGIAIVSAPAGCGPKGGCVPEASGDRNVVIGNLVSANGGNGVAMWADVTGPTSDENVVQGNYIGTDVTGMVALGNLRNGVEIRAGSNNMVGGTTPGSRNVISGNVGNGIVMQGFGHTIQGNFIGTNAAGTAAVPNGSVGVLSMARASAGGPTLIGGTTLGARNVISGNTGPGVFFGAGSTKNFLQGNYIGTDVTGSAAIPNSVGVGSKVSGDCPSFCPLDHTIGGGIPGAGNVISGNRNQGIELQGVRYRVMQNLIGTDATGLSAIPNGFGIHVGPHGCLDGVNLIADNMIAHNAGKGVGYSVVCPAAASASLTITRNKIFDNSELGIDLGPDGVTPNDPGDGDSGENGLQNFPVLTTAEVANSAVTITGVLDTPNVATTTVELFGNDVADPSGYGEGQRYAASVTPAANGCFSVTFPAAAADHFYTSTATDAAGNTSEFSRAIPQGTRRAAIGLAPAAATNVVASTHTVTATLTNTAGGPVPCATVTFTVGGANTATGVGTTDINGTTSFSYTGVWAGRDRIIATSGPAKGSATKTWLFPASTPGRVEGEGAIPSGTGTARFELEARGAQGELEFRSAERRFHGTVAATVIVGSRATIYGFIEVDERGGTRDDDRVGTDPQFRVEVADNGKDGAGDVFRILTQDGTAAGGALIKGDIRIRAD